MSYNPSSERIHSSPCDACRPFVMSYVALQQELLCISYIPVVQVVSAKANLHKMVANYSEEDLLQ